jgi:hypothetical protein
MSQTIKNSVQKKIEIAIDKLIDALSYSPDAVVYKINEALDAIREVENRIDNTDAHQFKKY